LWLARIFNSTALACSLAMSWYGVPAAWLVYRSRKSPGNVLRLNRPILGVLHEVCSRSKEAQAKWRDWYMRLYRGCVFRLMHFGISISTTLLDPQQNLLARALRCAATMMERSHVRPCGYGRACLLALAGPAMVPRSPADLQRAIGCTSHIHSHLRFLGHRGPSS